MQKASRKCLALLLCAALLLPLSWAPAGAQSPAKLRVALISDIHLYPEELAGGYNEAFRADQYVGRSHEQKPGLLRSALAAIKARAARGEIDYLLIPGDLTREGELLGHEQLAKALQQFEKETGVPVAVIPGNHDINNGGAATFVNGVKEKVASPTPEAFRQIYAQFGYDLRGNRADYVPQGEDKRGSLSYAVDLGPSFRLVAIDIQGGDRVTPELRAWVVGQCRAAVKAGKTVVGMGHYNLGESFTGHLRVISDSLDNMREICEEFADAGMHFYFSGHMHLSEISPWVSDSGEVLYDIVVPGLFSYPGDFRVVNFSAAGGRIEADVRSHPVDEVLPVTANGVTYPSPYYASNLEHTFGHSGEGLRGLTKAAIKDNLVKLYRSGGIAAKVRESVDFGPINALMRYLDERLFNNPDTLAVLGGVIDEVFGLRVSKLPCTRFIDEVGFGDPKKPGTVEDAGNSIITYMFWKKFDPKDDPFIQDILRRIRDGDLIDQVLGFAVPKILDILGAEILPLLAGVNIGLVNRALQAALGAFNLPLLLLLALVPGTKDTISATLYDFAIGAVTSQSPTDSGTDAKLVYDGPMAVPTGPNTFRLPYDLSVNIGSLGRSAEITWYTKASLTSPAVKLTDKAGNPVEGLSITYSSEPVVLTVGELDLGIAQMMGYKMNAIKHTAKVEGLELFESYQFTAGDSEFGWWAASQKLEPTEKPVSDFFGQGQVWFSGMLKQPGTMWRNRDFYHWQ